MTKEEVFESVRAKYICDRHGEKVCVLATTFDRLLDAFMLVQEQRDQMIAQIESGWPEMRDQGIRDGDAAVERVLKGEP